MTELQLDLSAEEIGKIVNFLGYGRPSAPVWFIGIEEGLGKMNSEDAIKNLKARASFGNTMDLRDALMALQEGGQPIDIERRCPPTQVWQWMAKIMLAYSGREDWRNLESAKKYVQFSLGRCNGETFLAELSPIPAGSASDKKWITWLKNADPELSIKIKQRKEELKRLLRENTPDLVVCYGNGNRWADDFAELLSVEWGPQVCPGVCASHDSKRLLLPFFGNGRMSYSVIEDLLHSGLLGSRNAGAARI